MPTERLLERIRNTEKNPHHRGSSDSSRIVMSIMRHLQRLLNTRQGSVSIASDYGIPDFSSLVGNYNTESVQDLAESIQLIIQEYEPRLSQVRVIAEPQGLEHLELHFKITGRLKVDNQRNLPVMFRTVVDPEGRVQVKQRGRG